MLCREQLSNQPKTHKMRIIATTADIVNAYKTFELGTLKINTISLINIFGKPNYNNDDNIVWYVSIINNNVVENFILTLRFNGLMKSHELSNDKRVSYSVTSDCENGDLSVLKEVIINGIFELIKK